MKHSTDPMKRDEATARPWRRWATREEQANNRTDSVHVEYRGQRMTLTQAWRAAGEVCSLPNVFRRFNDGWTVAASVETPPNPVKRTKKPLSKLNEAVDGK